MKPRIALPIWIAILFACGALAQIGSEAILSSPVAWSADLPGSPGGELPKHAQRKHQSKKAYALEDEQAFGEFTVRVHSAQTETEGGAYFEVLRNGRQIYRQEGYKFYLGQVAGEEPNPDNELIAMGKDITGKGIPNLVISEWTGGAHCCIAFYIFELGKAFRRIAVIDAGHSDLAHFEDLDGDSNLEFVASDWTFAYWRAGFAQSPAPQVILRFQNGAYRLAFDQMRKDPPPAEELRKLTKEIQTDSSWKKGEAPVELWEEMLDLIYTGNADLAWHFFATTWPPAAPGKNQFLKDFRKQLAQSPHWTEIKTLNRGKI